MKYIYNYKICNNFLIEWQNIFLEGILHYEGIEILSA